MLKQRQSKEYWDALCALCKLPTRFQQCWAMDPVGRQGQEVKDRTSPIFGVELECASGCLGVRGLSSSIKQCAGDSAPQDSQTSSQQHHITSTAKLQKFRTIVCVILVKPSRTSILYFKVTYWSALASSPTPQGQTWPNLDSVARDVRALGTIAHCKSRSPLRQCHVGRFAMIVLKI